MFFDLVFLLFYLPALVLAQNTNSAEASRNNLSQEQSAQNTSQQVNKNDSRSNTDGEANGQANKERSNQPDTGANESVLSNGNPEENQDSTGSSDSLSPITNDDVFEQLEALNADEASYYEAYRRFIYNPSRRKNPFLPPENLIKKDNYNDSDKEAKTGLEAYDLESLKLTSLLWDINEPRALIKDPSGQTHKVREGVKIGRKGGYIAKIREGEMVVVEKELVQGEDGLEKEIFKTQVLKMGR